MASDSQLTTIDSDASSPATADYTMQAIVQDRYGSADVLRLARIARPEIGDNDVLVRVRAASIHIGDWHVMTGLPYLLRVVGFGFRAPKARVRGMDVAGTIEAVGQNVTRFELGDDVFGTCAGSFAEQANARRRRACSQAGKSQLRAGGGRTHLCCRSSAGSSQCG